MRKIRFEKQVTVDFLDHRDEGQGTDKTFFAHQIVEVERVEETVRGFVDLIFENGDAAIGVGKQFINLVEE
jgi:hypothetical protein